jgi:aminoglycoside/choline kinase family phosphotransferase
VTECATVSTIPVNAAAITAEWIDEVLGSPGVVAVKSENLGEGVGILAEVSRLHLTYAPSGTGPATVVVKCSSPAPENVFLCQMMGFYHREVSFYREVADRLDAISVPNCHHADINADGTSMVIVLDEITGMRNPNQIVGLDIADAERIIDTVAGLHLAFWDTPELHAMTWLPPMNNDLYKAGQAMAQANFDGWLAKFGAELDDATVAIVRRLSDGYVRLLDWLVSLGNPTFTHTDCRAENYLFSPSGDVTVLDFQLCTKHVGVWDVANLMTGSLTADVRHANEQTLLRRYHDQIVADGRDYSWDTCWRDYLACVLQQAVAGVITANLAGGNERGDELLFQLQLRPFHAVRDLDAGRLLDDIGI